MKNVTRTLGVLALAVIATAAFSWTYETAYAGPGGNRGNSAALSAPIGQGYKIGVVNRKEALNAYEKQQVEWAALEKELQAKQAEADRQSDAIKAEQERLKNSENMTQQEREALALKIQEDTLDYETAFKKLQNEIDVAAARFFANTMKEVDAMIKTIGAEGDFHLILEADPNPRSGSAVLYYATSIDITPQVIQRLNSK